jgi:hypothetical protein
VPILDPLASWILAAGAGYATYYTLACAAAPFGRCRACRGTGRHRGDRLTHAYCQRCQATGRRLRIGRRLYNHLRAEHHDYRRTRTRPEPKRETRR